MAPPELQTFPVLYRDQSGHSPEGQGLLTLTHILVHLLIPLGLRVRLALGSVLSGVLSGQYLICWLFKRPGASLVFSELPRPGVRISHSGAARTMGFYPAWFMVAKFRQQEVHRPLEITGFQLLDFAD